MTQQENHQDYSPPTLWICLKMPEQKKKRIIMVNLI